MNKEELLTKLNGLENAEEVAEYILSENSKAIAEAGNGGAADELTAAKTALEQTNAELETLKDEMKKYGANGEFFIDPAEFNRLKNFEHETVDKAEAKRKTDALLALFDSHNVPGGVKKLLLKAIDVNGLTVAQDGKVADGEKLMATLKEEYTEAFAIENKGRAGLSGKNDQPPEGDATEEFIKLR